MGSNEIAEIKKRIQQLEEMNLEMHKVLHGTYRKVINIESDIRKLKLLSLDKIIETVERGIAAYRSSCQFQEEIDTLGEKQTQVMFSSIGR